MGLAVLFGSVARGQPRPHSDVEALPLHDELALAGDLARALGREVDLVRIDQASTYVRWQIARDGQPLVAAPGTWTRLRAAAAAEHADFADVLARSAELFRRRVARAC